MWLELQLNPNRYDLKAFDMHHYVITSLRETYLMATKVVVLHPECPN